MKTGFLWIFTKKRDSNEIAQKNVIGKDTRLACAENVPGVSWVSFLQDGAPQFLSWFINHYNPH